MIPCEAELRNDSASEGITRRIASRQQRSCRYWPPYIPWTRISRCSAVAIARTVFDANLPKRYWSLKLITVHLDHIEVTEFADQA